MIASRKGDMAALAKYTKEYYELTKEDSPTKNLVHGLELGDNLSDSERIQRYEKLISENRKLDFEFSNETIYPRLASLHLEVNQPKSTLKYLALIDTINDADLTFRSDYYQMQYKAFEKMGNAQLALVALKKMIHTGNLKKQEVRNAELMDIETKYQTKQKEDAIALLTTQDQLKSYQLSQATRDRMLFAGLSLFLLLILGALAYLFIQNRKRKEELEHKNSIIKRALADKDTLLREIHHRVKNNLQVISSLLNLQSNYIEDDAALKAINEGKNRVTSMALIHQNLYQQEDLTAINCAKYFEDLIDSIFESYNIGENDLRLVKEVSDLNIDVETMVPFGFNSQ